MPGEIPPRTTSDSAAGDAFNQLAETLRSHQPLGAPGLLTSHGPHGVTREPEEPLPPYGGSGDAAAPVLLRVKSVAANHLVCRSWDGTTEGATDILVARKFKTRNSIVSEVIEGILFTYTYPSPTTRQAIGSNGVSETQYLTPPYLVNDVIWADSGPTLLPGITLMERDGRDWAAY